MGEECGEPPATCLWSLLCIAVSTVYFLLGGRSIAGFVAVSVGVKDARQEVIQVVRLPVPLQCHFQGSAWREATLSPASSDTLDGPPCVMQWGAIIT